MNANGDGVVAVIETRPVLHFADRRRRQRGRGGALRRVGQHEIPHLVDARLRDAGRGLICHGGKSESTGESVCLTYNSCGDHAFFYIAWHATQCRSQIVYPCIKIKGDLSLRVWFLVSAIVRIQTSRICRSPVYIYSHLVLRAVLVVVGAAFYIPV